MPREASRDEERLTDRLASATVSEPRVLKLESDLAALRERVAVLEAEGKQRTSSSDRSFQLKLALIAAVTNVASFVVAYVLTKIGIL